MRKNSIKNSDFQKYYRQILLKKIGVAGQKKILGGKVLVIGAGGLGCPLILYLLHSGLGNLGIADHDKIELSNLSRQVLFTKRDIGKYKTYVSKKIAKKINNKTIIKTYTQKIKLNNIDKIAKNYPIICDGTDNFESRLLINDYCIKNKKILISSAISEFDGQLFYFYDSSEESIPADPLRLMNALKRATAMDDATSPSDALDEALKAFEDNEPGPAIINPVN